MLAIPAHRCMHTMAPWRQRQCGLSAWSCGFWLLSWGCPVFAEAHDHHGYASSSRLVDMCNWCGCSMTRSGADTAGSSASKSGENEDCRGTILSHGYLPYIVASDSKLLETSRGLGTGGPAASRHRAPAQRARGGKVRNAANCLRSIETLNLDAFVLSWIKVRF